MNEQMLIVFTRVPVPGQVKTRLIPALGAGGACKVYEALVRRTITAVELARTSVSVWYANGAVPESDDWGRLTSNRFVQPQVADLGERMEAAFVHAFQSGASRVVIIGTDCPEINSGLLDQAFEALVSHDAVIGPATDGGYYLLGLASPCPEIFAQKQWSTHTVASDTIADFRRMRMTHVTLPTLRDIDEPNDLEYYPDLLNECGLHPDQAIEKEDTETDEKASHGEANP